MNELPANLRPYGTWLYEPLPQAQFTPQQWQAGVERMRQKIELARRTAHNEPRVRANVGFGSARLNWTMATLLLVCASASTMSNLFLGGTSPGSWFLTGLCWFSVVNFAFTRLVFLFVTPLRTPKGALQRFFWAVTSKRIGLGYDLLAGAGRQDDEGDVILRSSEAGAGVTRSFSSGQGFEDYWSAQFPRLPWQFRWTWTSITRVHEAAEDLSIIEGKATVRTYSTLRPIVAIAAMLLLSALVLGLPLLSVVTGAAERPKDGVPFGPPLEIVLLIAGALLLFVVQIPAMLWVLWPLDRHELLVRKILIRINGQWRILNGSLMGPEEADPSWLAVVESIPLPRLATTTT